MGGRRRANGGVSIYKKKKKIHLKTGDPNGVVKKTKCTFQKRPGASRGNTSATEEILLIEVKEVIKEVALGGTKGMKKMPFEEMPGINAPNLETKKSVAVRLGNMAEPRVIKRRFENQESNGGKLRRGALPEVEELGQIIDHFTLRVKSQRAQQRKKLVAASEGKFATKKQVLWGTKNRCRRGVFIVTITLRGFGKRVRTRKFLQGGH